MTYDDTMTDMLQYIHQNLHPALIHPPTHPQSKEGYMHRLHGMMGAHTVNCTLLEKVVGGRQGRLDGGCRHFSVVFAGSCNATHTMCPLSSV